MENQVATHTTTESKFKFPTELVELPSKGLLYPEGNPLSSGKVEMKYMTAREEDILTNQSYISKGTVLDELLKSLIISPINYNDLLNGDKNALLVASRVLGYGKDYKFSYGGEEHTVDLSLIEAKPLNENSITKGKNEFFFTLPHSKNQVSFKLLTHGDEKKIDREITGLKKINKNAPELTTRLKYTILSVDGSYEPKDIRDFVDNYLLARDSRALREEVRNMQPDIDLTFFPEGSNDEVSIPIGLDFFWPDL